MTTMTDNRASFTIQEFCLRNGISMALFRKLQKTNRAPRLMYLNKAIRVSAAAERAWQIARENPPTKKERELIEQQRRERSRIAVMAGNAAAASPKHISKRQKKDREKKRAARA